MPGYPPSYPPQGYAPVAYYDGPEDPPEPFPSDAATQMEGDCADCGGKDCAGGKSCGLFGGCGDGCGCYACRTGFAGVLLYKLIDTCLPYGAGGKCAPRWYDITADAMVLRRDTVSRRIDFASDGIGGPIVLSTDSLDFDDDELGLRLTAAVPFMAGSNLEFTYFGLYDFSTGAAVTRTTAGSLFSVYSQFGVNPMDGFDETDRSTFQRIIYESSLDNFELNWRRRWTGPNCRLQGSILAGVRYLYIAEDFQYDTTGGDDFATPGVVEINGAQITRVATRNSLTGFQLGGDLWTNIKPGITIGGELKAGVFGNYAHQSTDVRTLPPGLPSFFEEREDMNDIAFAGEGRVELIYRTSPNWAIRGGYMFFYVDGVALAPENFNTVAPPNIQVAGAPRPAAANDNGDVFYHGGFLGVEWMW